MPQYLKPPLTTSGPADTSPSLTWPHPSFSRTASPRATPAAAYTSSQFRASPKRPSRTPNLHQNQHHRPRNRPAKPPKISIAVLQRGELLEIHPEVANKEGHGQEEDGHEGELLHALVLVRAHGVEDQVDHAVGGAAHAF